MSLYADKVGAVGWGGARGGGVLRLTVSLYADKVGAGGGMGGMAYWGSPWCCMLTRWRPGGGEGVGLKSDTHPCVACKIFCCCYCTLLLLLMAPLLHTVRGSITTAPSTGLSSASASHPSVLRHSLPDLPATACQEPWSAWAKHLASFGCQANVVAGSPYYKMLIGRLCGYTEENVDT